MSDSVVFYGLSTCDTCRRAKRYLQEKGIKVEERAIRQAPPTGEELARWLDPADLKRFFNTSSEDYRSRGLSKRDLSLEEAVALMQETPNLIKRPVVVRQGKAVFGFKQEALDALLRG